MSDTIVVEVEQRSELGKNAAGRLRRAGSPGDRLRSRPGPPSPSPSAPSASPRSCAWRRGRTPSSNLSLVGQERTRAVMIREIHRDPSPSCRSTWTSCGWTWRRPSTCRSHPPAGNPIGVKTEGGVVEFLTREIDVECLPGEIPEHVDVDVSELHVNQNVHVRSAHRRAHQGPDPRGHHRGPGGRAQGRGRSGRGGGRCRPRRARGHQEGQGGAAGREVLRGRPRSRQRRSALRGDAPQRGLPRGGAPGRARPRSLAGLPWAGAAGLRGGGGALGQPVALVKPRTLT